MDEQTTCSSASTINVGDRSDDNHWVIVAVLDPALVAVTPVFDHVA